MASAGLKTIIFLSFVLAIGFLLVILSCALFGNWLPLLVALTFVLAPLPNSVCGRLGNADDLSADYSNAPVDLGQFLTAVTIVTGLALPLVLAHAEVIHPAACWMSIGGGVLVYATIIIYAHFFSRESEVF